MWFWIWVALVLGTIVGALLLARLLWRQVTGLFRVAGECSDRLGTTMAESTARAEELVAARPERVPALAEDPVDVLDRATWVRRARLERALLRRRPRPEVYRRWLSIYR